MIGEFKKGVSGIRFQGWFR